mmetsp:Transcript_25778/g.79301  ORF Transcript_25778/g.79301 Transcript_25778/m.79301 type:complete len:201 (-) Transcript_25778:1378-1980(-)
MMDVRVADFFQESSRRAVRGPAEPRTLVEVDASRAEARRELVHAVLLAVMRLAQKELPACRRGLAREEVVVRENRLDVYGRGADVVGDGGDGLVGDVAVLVRNVREHVRQESARAVRVATFSENTLPNVLSLAAVLVEERFGLRRLFLIGRVQQFVRRVRHGRAEEFRVKFLNGRVLVGLAQCQRLVFRVDELGPLLLDV